MKRPELIKAAKEAGITGFMKMKNVEIEEALQSMGEQEIDEKTSAECPVETKEEQSKPKVEMTLFRSDTIENIDGFQFSPYLLVRKDDTIRRGIENVNVIEFLRNSAWFNKKFWEVTGEELRSKPTKNQREAEGYTEKELQEFAAEYDIDLSECRDTEEKYMKIFGGDYS